MHMENNIVWRLYVCYVFMLVMTFLFTTVKAARDAIQQEWCIWEKKKWENALLDEFKGIVHPKIKMLSLFTHHPHVVP